MLWPVASKLFKALAVLPQMPPKLCSKQALLELNLHSKVLLA